MEQCFKNRGLGRGEEILRVRSLQDQKHPSSEKVPVEEETSQSLYPWKRSREEVKAPSKFSGAEPAVEVVNESRPLREPLKHSLALHTGE